MKLVKKWMLAGMVTCCAYVPLAAPALAQGWQIFVPSISPASSMLTNQLLLQPLLNAKNQDRPADKNAQPITTARPAANPALLSFTPNLATRKRNLAGFVAKTRAQSPENADQMEQLFSSTDVFAAMAQGLAPTGLRIDNVADTYAAYWITAWEAANGITGSTTSRAQAQGVKAQASRALLSTPEFTKASAAQKQELAEALLIQAALISASMEGAAGDAAQKKAVGKAVRTGAKAMGLDLDTIELGPNGFGPAK